MTQDVTQAFRCPNCQEQMYLNPENAYRTIQDFGTCDVWECHDCSHIYLLDWRDS